MRLLLFVFLILTTACGQSGNPSALVHESEPVLKVASAEPESLDPRLIRSTSAVTAAGLFYEGILRHDYQGRIVNGLAKEIQVSDDQKTWTISLRDAQWSNGNPITSFDLRDTWISTLTPAFPAPNAYQMYVIKGAKEFKEGTIKVEDLGIKTPDPKTIVIELKEPVPFFRELLASHFFFPVHEVNRTGKAAKNEIIANGPFQLVSWDYNDSIKAKKNPLYWDRNEVRLDEVELVFVDDNTALNMFRVQELDWVGSPSGNIPSDAIKGLEAEKVLNLRPAAATSWFRVNTTRPILNNKKFRQALYYSIDRKAIAGHLLQGKQLPAPGIVPTFWLDPPIEVGDSFNPGKAWELFQDALAEVDTDRDSLEPFTICYRSGERAQKVAQAVQQQWENALGIKITLEQCEGVAIFDKWTHMNYDLAFGSWVADIEDPVNFLQVFDTKNTPTNHTGWENEQYRALIERSYLETGDLRKATLGEAQSLLIEEAPVIPVFYHTFLYAKQPNVHGIWLSKIGVLDFKHTFIDDSDFDELEPLD